MFPLILGTTIYAVSRPDTSILSCVGCKRYVHLPVWITYNLPDALWLFSFLSCIQIIWSKNSKEKLIWIFGIVAASIGTEILQRFHFIPGTFDAWDIFAYILATVSNILIFRTLIFKQ